MTLLKHLIYFSFIYLTCLYVFGVLPTMQKQKSIYMLIHNVNIRPGSDESYSLPLFNEINQYNDIDILLIGSSRVNNNVDPSIFKDNGMKTFNLATSSQTPLNTYYLLMEYLDRLNPKMIIFDIFPGIIGNTGFYSFVDTMINREFSLEAIKMGFKTINLQFINVILITFIDRIFEPLGIKKQTNIYSGHNTEYIKGGLSLILDEKFDSALPSNDVIIKKKQIDYFAKTLQLIKNKNIICKVITVPFVNADTTIFSNYTYIKKRYRKITNNYGFTFKDYNEFLSIEKTFYNDWSHFNYKGVNLFTKFLINDLKNSRFFLKK